MIDCSMNFVRVCFPCKPQGVECQPSTCSCTITRIMWVAMLIEASVDEQCKRFQHRVGVHNAPLRVLVPRAVHLHSAPLPPAKKARVHGAFSETEPCRGIASLAQCTSVEPGNFHFKLFISGQVNAFSLAGINA